MFSTIKTKIMLVLGGLLAIAGAVIKFFALGVMQRKDEQI